MGCGGIRGGGGGLGGIGGYGGNWGFEGRHYILTAQEDPHDYRDAKRNIVMMLGIWTRACQLVVVGRVNVLFFIRCSFVFTVILFKLFAGLMGETRCHGTVCKLYVCAVTMH